VGLVVGHKMVPGVLHTQAPPEQVPKSQFWLQAPQSVLSVCKSTQVPLHKVAPGLHVHALFEQVPRLQPNAQLPQ
jgi:hypothetical protein